MLCQTKFVSETLDLRKGVLLAKKPKLGSCGSNPEGNLSKKG